MHNKFKYLIITRVSTIIYIFSHCIVYQEVDTHPFHTFVIKLLLYHFNQITQLMVVYGLVLVLLTPDPISILNPSPPLKVLLHPFPGCGQPTSVYYFGSTPKTVPVQGYMSSTHGLKWRIFSLVKISKTLRSSTRGFVTLVFLVYRLSVVPPSLDILAACIKASSTLLHALESVIFPPNPSPGFCFNPSKLLCGQH